MNNVVSLNSNTYHGYSLEEAVKGAKAAGVRFLEISAVIGHTEHARWDMSDTQIAEIKELLRDNDMTVLGMCGHSNIMTPEGRTQFVHNLDLAVRLGASYVVTGTGDTHDDADVIDDDRELVEILKQLTAEAAQRDLTIGIETHGNNYGTGAQIQALLGKVGASNLGINYDTANVVFYGGIDPYDDLDACADRVIGVHLKEKAGAPNEWNFPAIGDGYLDFARILRTLGERAASAPLSIEIEFEPAGPASLEEVDQALLRSVNTVRRLLVHDNSPTYL